MFKLVVIALVVIPRVNCFLEDAKEFFVYRNISQTGLDDCHPLIRQQYYWKNIGDDNSSDIIKLDCLHRNLSIDKYFPKCCPPNYAYYKKYHQCILSNTTTNIYDAFGMESLLIKTDLSNCSVVLDHILRKDEGGVAINSDRSLNLDSRFYPLGSYCVENHLENEEEFVVRTCEDVDACRTKTVKCIRKCCPDGQYYEGTSCQLGSHYGLSLENNTRFMDKDENYNGVIISKPCRRYIGSPKYKFYITEDGTTVIQELGVWRKFSIEENYYCMEYVRMTKKHEILLCMTDTRLTPETGSKGTIMIISCVCLLLTLFVYFILPDLKNLIGNIVITYCSCLFVAFVLLIYLQFEPNPGELCDYVGFAIAFSFFATFAWMTILSYEIWRVLGSMVVEYGHRLPGEKTRYLQYSLFGWLVPSVIISINFLDYKFNIFPESIHLIVGNQKCMFENIRSRGEYGHIFHFVLPSAVLLLINLIVFIKTITYICRVKNEIQRMKVLDSNLKQKKWKTFLADKEKIGMVTRIFFLMGINWLFEIISSIVDMQKNTTLSTIEIIFDTVNALQGVFIFCIFMLKKKILKSVLKILNIKLKNRRSSVATCSTEVVMIPTSVRTSKT